MLSVVFLDRDGTIIEDVRFIARPEQARLLPDAAPTIRRLNEAGVPVIVVTNQSGIGRGYFTAVDYERVRARIDELLAAERAHVDATYYCPHHPDAQVACECRKPGTLLFRQAVADHYLDPHRAAFIGDRWRDVAPALELGGRGIMVPSPLTPPGELARAHREVTVAASLSDAVDTLLSEQ